MSPLACNGAGNVLVCKNGEGSPISRRDAGLGHYYYCGYDNLGNLYVDGTDSTYSGFRLAELPKGRSRFKDIALSEVPASPAAIQWDGRYLAVTDTKQSFEFEIKGARGTEVGTTPLVGSEDVLQFWISGKRVSVADYSADSVGFYHYPAGGSPTKTFGIPYAPWGVTVTLAPQ